MGHACGESHTEIHISDFEPSHQVITYWMQVQGRGAYTGHRDEELTRLKEALVSRVRNVTHHIFVGEQEDRLFRSVSSVNNLA